MGDILSRAEAIAERYNSSGFIHKEATLLLPDLIAEIKRLEDALVEERGKLFHQFGEVELDKPTESDCKFAREQLRAEGAIR